MLVKTKQVILLLTLISYSYLGYATEYSMNEMPMYGGKHNPTVPENAQMSENAAKMGWQYYYKGDFKTAIKRFNQAWMFNRKSVDAFWGFGLIMGQRALKEDHITNIKASIQYLEKANEYSSAKNYKIIADLAHSYSLLAFILKGEGKLNKDVFEKAEKLFEEAKNINSKYPVAYFNWSVLEFEQGKYAKAKELMNRAKELGFKVNPDYEKELNSKIKL